MNIQNKSKLFKEVQIMETQNLNALYSMINKSSFKFKYNKRIVVENTNKIYNTKYLKDNKFNLSPNCHNSCALLKKYFYILVLMFNILKTISLNQPRLLTNSTNRHLNHINIIKTNYDYNTVYSVDLDGIMKIWNFNITNLEFRQQINMSQTVDWYMANALYIWNNGEKLFFASWNQRIQITTLNSTNKLYIQQPTLTPSLGDRVYYTQVNLAGTIIYAATGIGCNKIEWNGSNWIVNNPPYLQSLGTYMFTYIRFISNQQKIVIFNHNTSIIVILKRNGSSYSSHQNISTGIMTQPRTCAVSTNQLYISCYGFGQSGGYTQFNNYKLDIQTDMYINVSQKNLLTGNVYTQLSYINKNQVYTIGQYYRAKIYKYQFTNSTGNISYTLLNSYSLNGQIPLKIAYQRQNSEFQLISTYSGNIYILVSECNNKTSLIPNCISCYKYNSICQKCKQGFNLYNDRCDYCLAGYYINGYICSSCGVNCKTCANLTACATCLPGWNLNGTVCDSCLLGYYLNGSNVCSFIGCPLNSYIYPQIKPPKCSYVCSQQSLINSTGMYCFTQCPKGYTCQSQFHYKYLLVFMSIQAIIFVTCLIAFNKFQLLEKLQNWVGNGERYDKRQLDPFEYY